MVVTVTLRLLKSELCDAVLASPCPIRGIRLRACFALLCLLKLPRPHALTHACFYSPHRLLPWILSLEGRQRDVIGRGTVG